ncbi:MAG: stage II sporulation protein M [Acidimicrobiales bacterium]|nr:stage II sporulation protein M [Acidimicrobiales bacterium]
MYRRSTTDLSILRREFPNTPDVEALSEIVSRVHGRVYGSIRRGESFEEWFTYRVWNSVRNGGKTLAFVALFQIAIGILAAIWAHLEPGSAASAIGITLPIPKANVSSNFIVNSPFDYKITLAVYIFTHNIEISILAFAGGALLGIPTFALLSWNALNLGVLVVLEFQAGNGEYFMRLVLPHGLLELSLVTVAATSGLLIAKAELFATIRSRGQELRLIRNSVVDSLLLSLLLLVVSGLVEALVTTLYLPLWSAISLGVILFSLFWGGVFILGRSSRESKWRDKDTIEGLISIVNEVPHE